MNLLSETMRMDYSLVAARYEEAFTTAVAQGNGFDTSVRLATSNLYGILQRQSLLLAVKELVGYMLIAAIILIIISLFLPFYSRK